MPTTAKFPVQQRTYCNEFDEETSKALLNGTLGVRIQEVCGMHEDDWSSALLKVTRMLSAPKQPDRPWPEVLATIKEDSALSLVLSNIARFAIDEIAPQFYPLTEKVLNCLGRDKDKALCHLKSNPNHYVVVTIPKSSEEARKYDIHGQYKIMNGEKEHIAWFRDRHDYSCGPGFGFPHDYFLLTQFPDLEIQPFVSHLIETREYHPFGKDEGAPYPKDEYFRWMLEHLPDPHKEKLVDSLLHWIADQKDRILGLLDCSSDNATGNKANDYRDLADLNAWTSIVRSLKRDNLISEVISEKLFLALREQYAEPCILYLENFKVSRTGRENDIESSSMPTLYFVQDILALTATFQPVESKSIGPHLPFWEDKLDSLAYFSPKYAFFLFDVCIAGILKTIEADKREAELPRLLTKTHEAYRRITDNLALPSSFHTYLNVSAEVLGWDIYEFDPSVLALRKLDKVKDSGDGKVEMIVQNFGPGSVSEYTLSISKEVLESKNDLPYFPFRGYRSTKYRAEITKQENNYIEPVTIMLR